MRTPMLFSVLLVLATIGAGADDSLEHAHRARALLGPEVWSRVIRVENDTRGGIYPRSLHALVFELAGILWFYSDVNGTQSFSLHRGRLAEEKADFAPLLRDIERGFARWVVLEAEGTAGEAAVLEGDLPNGCFIESYAALRRLVARGVPVSEPRLLSFYPRSAARRPGHTVLAYTEGGRIVVVDPARSDEGASFSPTLGRDPHRLAKAVAGREVERAQVLPLDLPGNAAGRMLAAHRLLPEMGLDAGAASSGPRNM